MSKYIIRAATLQEIADAIRTKTGKSDKISVDSFAKEIRGISDKNVPEWDVKEYTITGGGE